MRKETQLTAVVDRLMNLAKKPTTLVRCYIITILDDGLKT